MSGWGGALWEEEEHEERKRPRIPGDSRYRPARQCCSCLGQFSVLASEHKPLSHKSTGKEQTGQEPHRHPCALLTLLLLPPRLSVPPRPLSESCLFVECGAVCCFFKEASQSITGNQLPSTPCGPLTLEGKDPSYFLCGSHSTFPFGP